MPDTPMFQNTLSYSGQNLRDALRVVTMATGATFGARGGVRPGDPGLTVSLAGSTINVSPGTAMPTEHPAYQSEGRPVGKKGRYACDWSSDVCSSHLPWGTTPRRPGPNRVPGRLLHPRFAGNRDAHRSRRVRRCPHLDLVRHTHRRARHPRPHRT